jgi:hypothetical protein
MRAQLNSVATIVLLGTTVKRVQAHNSRVGTAHFQGLARGAVYHAHRDSSQTQLLQSVPLARLAMHVQRRAQLHQPWKLQHVDLGTIRIQEPMAAPLVQLAPTRTTQVILRARHAQTAIFVRSSAAHPSHVPWGPTEARSRAGRRQTAKPAGAGHSTTSQGRVSASAARLAKAARQGLQIRTIAQMLP